MSVAFRLPALLNAGEVDSDAAIVGLQARHILHGEWSWFLYGSGYQTSVDSSVAAAFFLVFGATPFALMLSTLAGHVAATALAFLTLARHLPRAKAFALALPLVFTSPPLHTYILNPPRQAALTLAFVAVFVIDGAPGWRGERLWRAAGGCFASLACFADPYALLLLPAIVLLGLLTALDGPRDRRAQAGRAAATVTGVAFGLAPLALLLSSRHSVHGETALTLRMLPHNLSLLAYPCLPWLFGTTAFAPRVALGYVPVAVGPLVHAVLLVGGGLFVTAVASGGAALRWKGTPWEVRRLGLFGFVVALFTLSSFLVSVMVMDLFSSRYLAAMVLFAPFAMAPLAARMKPAHVLVLLAPFLVATGRAGWLGYGDAVDGARIVVQPGAGARDEADLVAALSARGVRVAVADYWVSYRVTFLDHETVPVVPIHPKEDRYAPYRAAYRDADRSAYVFDPKRSREDEAAMEKLAFEGVAAWGKPIERLAVGTLTAVVFEKRPGAGL